VVQVQALGQVLEVEHDEQVLVQVLYTYSLVHPDALVVVCTHHQLK
jgi:hypothetical protein